MTGHNSDASERHPTDETVAIKAEPVAACDKFKMYKEKISQMVLEQHYFSESQDSEGITDEQVAEAEENAKDEILTRKSLQMQKEGTVSLLRII